MNMKFFLFILGSILFFSLIGAVTVESGVVFETSSAGSITFSFDINATQIEINSNYIYLTGVSYSRGGVDYSCNINHSENSVLDSVEFCVSSSTATTSEEEQGGSGEIYFVSPSQLRKGYSRSMKKGQKIKLNVGDKLSVIEIKSVDVEKGRIEFLIEGEGYEVVEGKINKIDSNNDGYYDLEVFINEIQRGDYANLKFKEIYEKIPKEVGEAVSEEVVEETKEIISEKNNLIYYVLGGIVFVALIVWIIFETMKKRKMERKYKYWKGRVKSKQRRN